MHRTPETLTVLHWMSLMGSSNAVQLANDAPEPGAASRPPHAATRTGKAVALAASPLWLPPDSCRAVR